MAGGKKNHAAAARARMAARARRQRWWKANKRRVLYLFLGATLIALLGLLTPWGPDYYRGKLEGDKFASPGYVNPGYIEGLYKLGVFYQYTMRNKQAMECFEEINYLFFGFRIVEFAQSPSTALEKRRQAEIAVSRGQSSGPPFRVDEGEIRFVGMAIWRAGEIMRKQFPSQFIARVFDDLYLQEFLANNEGKDDPEVTQMVKTWVNRFKGFQ